MFAVPDHFRTRPFARSEALEAGISARVLEGVQFVRLHEAVYRHRDQEMTFGDEVLAARLALPAAARTTGVTRLQELGLDTGPRRPLHFVIEGDHHLTLQNVFLHRTVLMPPHGELGVSAEAAFVAHCAEARVIEAIKVGSVLLHQGLVSMDPLVDLLERQQRRRGVPETQWVLPHLDPRCRSLPEAELVAILRFAGLPEPEVNQALELADGEWVTPDLWFGDHRRAVEYEGSQHQEERGQYVADIDRYAAYRRSAVGYVQVTKEMMRSPKAAVRRVHRELVDGGYDGPPPDFGERWSLLLVRVRDAVRPRPPGPAVSQPRCAA